MTVSAKSLWGSRQTKWLMAVCSHARKQRWMTYGLIWEMCDQKIFLAFQQQADTGHSLKSSLQENSFPHREWNQ